MEPLRSRHYVRVHPMLRVLVLLALILSLLFVYASPQARQQSVSPQANAAPMAVPPADSNFAKVILDQNVNDSLVEPLDLDVLPNGHVIYVTRRGVIKIHVPGATSQPAAQTLTVSTQFEDGLSGVIKDPNVATNRYIYLYYMRADATMARVSRFTMAADFRSVQLATEAVIIEWTVVRGGGHTGGGMAFDTSGNLYIASGDNRGATGYMQTASLETSGNTNDLRGKILRVRPNASGGGYTIPAGNLFAAGTQTRAEIYAMGFRNPYRIHWDSLRNRLTVGDVGPDASADGAEGVRGHDEFNIVASPGNYGWPWCIANNSAYAGQSCSAPVNNATGNTGLRSGIPAARGAWIWYHGNTIFPMNIAEGGGRAAMGGPTYRYDANLASSRKLPSYYDGTIILAEFSRNWIKEVRVDAGGTNILEFNRVAPSVTNLSAPIALDIGPDGAIYVLEYAGWFNGSANTRLSRIEWKGTATGVPPIAQATSSPDSGLAPLSVAFNSAGSRDPDGTAITYAWDFDGNGTTDSTAANPTFVYNTNGSYSARLTVRDASGATASVTVPIVVGNIRPVVNITSPAAGSTFTWNGTVNYSISVTDGNENPIDCARVTMQPALGHDDHAHPMQQIAGCSGSFVMSPSGHTPGSENIFMILAASYTDRGTPTLVGTQNRSYYAAGVPTPIPGSCGNTNVAAGKTATASSALMPASNAVDNNTATRWESTHGVDPGWITVDLGSTQSICRVNINWETASASAYQVQVSNDNVNFTTIRTVTGNTTLVNDLTGLSGSGRYLRIYGTARTTAYGYSIFELQAFTGSGTAPTATRTNTTGTAPTATRTNTSPPSGGCGTTNQALNKPATASSALSGANLAVDGSTTTRWESSHGVDPGWIRIDLGSTQSICRVNINWETAMARDYTVQVSNDGTNFTTIRTVTGNATAINDLTGLSGSGRYVRIHGTARTTVYGYSIWELQIFTGSGTNPTATRTNTTGTNPTATRTNTTGTNPTPTRTATTGTGTYRVLVFSKTAGFRHDSIAVGTQMIRDLGAANGFTVDATEDAALINDTNLAQYAAVVFLNTTGDILDATQQAAFERYIRSGKGYVGVHAAADTEYTWPWYGELVGAYFNGHPAIQQLTVRIEDTTHPSNAGIPTSWVRTDEPYNYNPNPRSKVKVLANYDEASYTGGTMGGDHPITWCRNFDGGRTWYTGMGHPQAAYSETHFRTHVLGGIRWAAGRVTANCTAPVQPPTPTIAPGCTTNVALNRTATSSSNENAGTTPNLAVDGNAGTRWSSLAADPQWIQIDLGVTRNICRVRLNWEAAFGRSYQIQVSGSATGPWTNIYSTTTGDGGIDDLSLSGSGRYVRMNGTARGTGYGYSLWEFEVYGS